MGRETISIDLNMSDSASKRKLMTALAPLQGLYDVHIKPVRVTRSNAANRFTWGVIVKLYAAYLSAVDGETVDPEEAFLDLKRRFLKRVIVNKETGEVIAVTVKRSSQLSPEDFSDFIEHSIAHLAECGIDVPEPGMYGVQLQAGSAPQDAIKPCAPPTRGVGKRSTVSGRKDHTHA